jgi:hypothetical protein
MALNGGDMADWAEGKKYLKKFSNGSLPIDTRILLWKHLVYR